MMHLPVRRAHRAAGKSLYRRFDPGLLDPAQTDLVTGSCLRAEPKSQALCFVPRAGTTNRVPVASRLRNSGLRRYRTPFAKSPNDAAAAPPCPAAVRECCRSTPVPGSRAGMYRLYGRISLLARGNLPTATLAANKPLPVSRPAPKVYHGCQGSESSFRAALQPAPRVVVRSFSGHSRPVTSCLTAANQEARQLMAAVCPRVRIR